MTELLLIEDDPVLGRGLDVSLAVEGYKVTWVCDLKSAFAARDEKRFDIVLLDLGLPDGNGITFLSALREAGSRIPVIILTAKTDEDSVVEGLQSGANDYIRKPFSKKELSARIKTSLKETQVSLQEVHFGNLRVFLDQRRVMFHEQEVELKRREYDILKYFIEHAEMVVSREELISSLNVDSEMFDRTIDSHVSHLRARLRKSGATGIEIASIYGVGYRLEKV